MTELCKGDHDLKLSTIKRVLPDIYICTKCPLVLIPSNVILSTFNALEDELQENLNDIASAKKDYDDFVKQNKESNDA